MPGRAPAQAEEAAAVERPMRDMLAGAADRLSLHMPGAQGRGPFGPLDPYRLETTELAATDDLYAPGGAIARAEALAARCAGAARTLMLTGGSTAGVQAMLLYAAGGGGAVILPRNAHLSALHLCAVAGLEAVFARPSFTASGLCYTTDESYLEALERRPDARALLAVRPDYYGALRWPARAAARARALGVPVLCDEAHGAHLNWDADVPTAGALGADLWVQSAHKTLPALNGAAWLHAGPGVDAARLRAMLRAVQTSSPSFVTLLALDDARAWMEAHGAQALARLKAAAARFHAQAASLGYADGQDEPGWDYDRTRVVLRAPEGGYAFSEALAARGVDVEMSDADRVVCILSPVDGPERLERLARTLREIAADRRRGPDGTDAARGGGSGTEAGTFCAACGTAARADGTGAEAGMPGAACAGDGAEGTPPDGLRAFAAGGGAAWLTPPAPAERVVPLREAFFAPSEAVPLECAAGRVSAVPAGPYPPGVALIAPGERVTEALVGYLAALDPRRAFGLGPGGTLRCLR